MGAVTTANIFFNQRITSVARTTRDEWGDKTSAILYTNIPARFTEDPKMIRAMSTEDIRVDALAYIGANYSIQNDDVVVFEGQNYQIVNIYNERDLFGNVDHIKLALKSR